MRFCCYLLHFSKVRGFKKYTFVGTIFGDNLGDKIVEIGVQMSGKKSNEKNTQIQRFWCPFWGQFSSKKSVVCRSKSKCALCVCVLHVGAREAGYIKMGPTIDDVGS